MDLQANGITFASVHDSYWTHASTIGKMSEIIRDTFVSLHSSDVLTRLRDEVGATLLSKSAGTDPAF